jgi:hypothetical protein
MAHKIKLKSQFETAERIIGSCGIAQSKLNVLKVDSFTTEEHGGNKPLLSLSD